MEWINVYDSLPAIGEKVYVRLEDEPDGTYLITERVEPDCKDDVYCCQEVAWWANPSGDHPYIGSVEYWAHIPKPPK